MRSWFFIVAVFVATPAFAQGTDGYFHVSTVASGDLATQCASKPEASLTGDFCVGYITAVLDTLSTNEIICPGPGFSTLQAVVIGRRHLAQHPEQWSEPPSRILTTAFKAVFPCQRRGRLDKGH